MSVTISVGGRFNASLAADVLWKRGETFQVYSSSPRRYWSVPSKNFRFVPMPSLIFGRVFGCARSQYLKEKDARLFDYITSNFNHNQILHGWASFCRKTAALHKKRGGSFVLDRACPHILFQSQLLSMEADFLGVAHEEASRYMVERMEEEYELADLIVVPSQYTYDSFLKYNIDKSKLRIVRLDANFQNKKSNLLSGAKKDTDFVLGAVGGNVLRKGLVYLIRAWNLLKLKNAKLLLKTDKSELLKYPEIEAILAQNESIKIIGYMNSIEEFYAACDVFCLPSIDDGFGMVVLEAMSCRLPVLTTSHVGASEFVQNNHNGFVSEPRNIDELKSNILKLYEDKELLQQMSANAYSSYKKYTSSKNSYSETLMNVYKELM